MALGAQREGLGVFSKAYPPFYVTTKSIPSSRVRRIIEQAAIFSTVLQGNVTRLVHFKEAGPAQSNMR